MAGDWRVDVLTALGAPVTTQNLRFLSAWQRQEGGHTANRARWNWLNTTSGPGPSINSVGVKAFPSYGVGIQQTALTIENGRYPAILAGLRGGNPYDDPGVAGDLSTWVSGSRSGNLAYAGKVLGSQASPVAGVPADMAGELESDPAASTGLGSCGTMLVSTLIAGVGVFELVRLFT